jgi:hypothetical protein
MPHADYRLLLSGPWLVLLGTDDGDHPIAMNLGRAEVDHGSPHRDCVKLHTLEQY